MQQTYLVMYCCSALSMPLVLAADLFGFCYRVTPLSLGLITTADPWYQASSNRRMFHTYSRWAAFALQFYLVLSFFGWVVAVVHPIVAAIVFRWSIWQYHYARNPALRGLHKEP